MVPLKASLKILVSILVNLKRSSRWIKKRARDSSGFGMILRVDLLTPWICSLELLYSPKPLSKKKFDVGECNRAVLFDIFDFNNQNSLSLADAYYILLTVVKSVFKMKRVNGFVNEEAIHRFIEENLADTPKINVAIIVK